MRIGTGYDVHRLSEGRRLILCGKEIPFEKGLLGHSDADVAVHAIMDALLGAAALGDIGLLLQQVMVRRDGSGFRIENVDCTIIAECPKLRPYIDDMRDNLAEVMGLDRSCVSIKATTEEGLGFTGSGEGIAAQAVCCLAEKGV